MESNKLNELKSQLYRELDLLSKQLNLALNSTNEKKEIVNGVIEDFHFFKLMNILNQLLYDKDYLNPNNGSNQNNGSNLEKIIKSLNSILTNIETSILPKMNKNMLQLQFESVIELVKKRRILISEILTRPSMGGKPLVKKSPIKKSAVKKSPVKKSPVKKSPVKKSPVKKSLVKKSPVKKSPVKKSSVKKSPVKKSPVKKSPVKKSPIKKSPVKKSPVKKSPVKK
jgi:hypothetical protein